MQSDFKAKATELQRKAISQPFHILHKCDCNPIKKGNQITRCECSSSLTVKSESGKCNQITIVGLILK